MSPARLKTILSNMLFRLSAPPVAEPPQILVDGEAWPVRLVHHARSRRYRLVFDAARAELDQAKRKAMYSEMGHLVRDEGGVIVPMFNDFLSGVSDQIQGWVADPNQELMNGRAQVKCWLA